MTKHNSNATSQGQNDAAAKMLVALIDEFIAVVLEENAMLARGLPASLSSVARRKTELAEAFESWVTAQHRCVPDRYRLRADAPPLRGAAAVSDDDERKYRASEGGHGSEPARIDAVMTAIREEMVQASPYGSNGRTYHVVNRTATRSGTYI